MAGLHVVKTQQQIHDGGFARTGAADQCHGFARRHGDIESGNAATALVVVEGHLLELNGALADVQTARAVPVGDGGFGVDHRIEALRCGHAALQLRVEACNDFDRAVDQQHGREEGEESPCGQGLV